MAPSFPQDALDCVAGLVADLPDAVRLLDRDGKVMLRNEASRLLAPDGLGHLCGETGERNPSCPACQIHEVLERGTFLRWHVAVHRDEKLSDYYEVTLNPVRDAANRLAGVLEILRDATATLGLEQYLIGRAESQDDEIRKHSQEALRLSAELGELRESQEEILERDRLLALNQLVAGLAHEIHTPLGAMLSSADLLKRSVERLKTTARKGSDEKSAAALLERIDPLENSTGILIEGARRIQAVVKTLRLFSRLDEAVAEAGRPARGLETSLELLQYRIGTRIRVVKSTAKLPEVFCRPDALNQVFMNLLLNAVQAIETEGEIRITTRLRAGRSSWRSRTAASAFRPITCPRSSTWASPRRAAPAVRESVWPSRAESSRSTTARSTFAASCGRGPRSRSGCRSRALRTAAA